MAERRPLPPDPPPQKQGNGNGGVWKAIAVALISLVGTVFVLVTTFTKGTATIEQIRDERIVSKEERAQSKSEAEGVWKDLQTLEKRVTELTREADRRGGRVEKLEDSASRLEARIIAVESVQGTIATLRVELRVLQEAQGRVEAMIRDLHEKSQRRPEPSQEAPRGGRFPRGVP